MTRFSSRNWEQWKSPGVSWEPDIMKSELLLQSDVVARLKQYNICKGTLFAKLHIFISPFEEGRVAKWLHHILVLSRPSSTRSYPVAFLWEPLLLPHVFLVGADALGLPGPDARMPGPPSPSYFLLVLATEQGGHKASSRPRSWAEVSFLHL